MIARFFILKDIHESKIQEWEENNETIVET